MTVEKRARIDMLVRAPCQFSVHTKGGMRQAYNVNRLQRIDHAGLSDNYHRAESTE